MKYLVRYGAAAMAVLLSICAAAEDSTKLRFNRDVRPILSDNCFQCHGPDAASRKADLRLDDRQVALDRGAIMPGDPGASHLIERVTSSDPAEQMPPPEANLSLTADEIETLKRWIAEGAEFEPHWAFIPVPDVQAPRIDDGAGWVRNTIDAFVLRRLQEEGIEPAAEADKETLLRRAALDLTGLPPTLEQMDAFLADDAPDAYEKAVDRLLASPHYGERMALDWLDVARYADTFGYQADRETKLWPWRDWVISAFNDNLPYDKFVTWQIAGDLYPQPTQEQVLATAFNRLHRQTNEGGSINEEYRVEYVADRVHTAGTAFLGLTMECARCHDHKFDPISQKNYYQFSAFFDDIDESGLYSHFTDATPSPSAFLYEGDQQGQHRALKEAIVAGEAAVRGAHAAERASFAEWLDQELTLAEPVKPVVHLPLESIEENKTADAAVADRAADTKLGPEVVTGKFGNAFKFSGESSVESKEAADFQRTDPFSLSLWLQTPKHLPHAVVAHRCVAESDAASRGWELMLENGKPTFSLIHFWPGNAIRVMAQEAIPLNEWVHVAVAYDGSSRADGVTLYVNGAPVAVDVVRDKLNQSIRYEDSGSKPALTLAARFRDVGFKDGIIDEFKVYDRELTAPEVEAASGTVTLDEALARRKADADPLAKAELFDYFVARHSEKAIVSRDALHASRKAESDFVEGLQEIMVMRDMAAPRQAYLLNRGMYDQRGEPVSPDTPEAIMPFAENLPKNRMGFAQWLTSRDNPLTSRVAVNRAWQLFFGRGLVETQEDFGSQGKAPSHPDLLDWLADRFMDSGWDVKALHKLIVTSATYRQRSLPQPELQERDPSNALLARGPRTRLPAELVRDGALAASGLLTPTIGGPSVKPYQPAGLWEEKGSATYTQDTGDALYRRSMYTFWKRTVPPPSMTTFDAPSREVCVARREVTATPLQALALLNGPQYVEAARVLAEQELLDADASIDNRVVDMFRRLTGRHPDETERDILRRAYEEQKALFETAPEAATQYVSTGEKVRNEEIDPVALAAATAVAQAIMNFDEFQVKQ